MLAKIKLILHIFKKTPIFFQKISNIIIFFSMYFTCIHILFHFFIYKVLIFNILNVLPYKSNLSYLNLYFLKFVW
ncbi:MAG: hypothetical protein EAZ85_07370 [Bacteroidetes bacterium]|nr:MAG: hypothetical protein EAZ85_07370 [Bacteroidota bacterium]TAG89465.1 MAG: hypothetical protein EAZ20_06440 [Bacteroidota bacterium]